MRGISKPEDNVFWIIALDDTDKNADDKREAQLHHGSRNQVLILRKKCQHLNGGIDELSFHSFEF
jgi:hypothetical protein